MSEDSYAAAQARERLPLKRLMEQNGDAPKNGQWKNFECPFCRNKSAGLFGKADRAERFKCFNTECPSGTSDARGSWDEVGYLAYKNKLASRTEAFKIWLQQAGLWPEKKRLSPSVLPGQPRRKNAHLAAEYGLVEEEAPANPPEEVSVPLETQPEPVPAEASAEVPEEKSPAKEPEKKRNQGASSKAAPAKEEGMKGEMGKKTGLKMNPWKRCAGSITS